MLDFRATFQRQTIAWCGKSKTCKKQKIPSLLASLEKHMLDFQNIRQAIRKHIIVSQGVPENSTFSIFKKFSTSATFGICGKFMEGGISGFLANSGNLENIHFWNFSKFGNSGKSRNYSVTIMKARSVHAHTYIYNICIVSCSSPAPTP